MTKAKTTTTRSTSASKTSRGTRAKSRGKRKQATKAGKGQKSTKTDHDVSPAGGKPDSGGKSPESEAQPVVRSEAGTFLPGTSGNLKGRPKGKKNEITELKQDLEIAIRKNLSNTDISAIVQSMLMKALEGNVGAAKLILDKVLSNAREAEDVQDTSGGLKIIIENATLDFLKDQPNVIDVTPTEVCTNE